MGSPSARQQSGGSTAKNCKGQHPARSSQYLPNLLVEYVLPWVARPLQHLHRVDQQVLLSIGVEVVQPEEWQLRDIPLITAEASRTTAGP